MALCFGSVILKHPLDIFHSGDGDDYSVKKPILMSPSITFNIAFVRHRILYEANNKGGQQYEQADG